MFIALNGHLTYILNILVNLLSSIVHCCDSVRYLGCLSLAGMLCVVFESCIFIEKAS